MITCELFSRVYVATPPVQLRIFWLTR